jgi:hypothetical protein
VLRQAGGLVFPVRSARAGRRHVKGDQLVQGIEDPSRRRRRDVRSRGRGIGLTVVSASASTPACTGITSGSLAGSCGDLANSNGYGLAVKVSQHYSGRGGNGRPQQNAQITSSNKLNTDTGTDFYAHQTNGNDNERTLEYAPGGNRTHECVTQAYANAGLTLARCNGGANQEFYGIGDTQDDTGNSNGGIQFVNAATGRVIVIGKGQVSTAPLANSSNTSGSYLHYVG